MAFVCVKKDNVIVLTNGTYECQLLLRWKNHHGDYQSGMASKCQKNVFTQFVQSSINGNKVL